MTFRYKSCGFFYVHKQTHIWYVVYAYNMCSWLSFAVESQLLHIVYVWFNQSHIIETSNWMHTKYVPYTHLFLCEFKFLLTLRIIKLLRRRTNPVCIYSIYTLHTSYNREAVVVLPAISCLRLCYLVTRCSVVRLEHVIRTFQSIKKTIDIIFSLVDGN